MYNTSTPETFVERRSGEDRRKNGDRRTGQERRHDFRDGSSGQRRTLGIWLRSLTKARLGVDRRKGDRRQTSDRRQSQLGHELLTQDEISDLLSL